MPTRQPFSMTEGLMRRMHLGNISPAVWSP